MFAYEPFWGMHFFWWAFWIFAIIAFFGYNIPSRARANVLDPQFILRIRFAKAEITEDEYQRLKKMLRLDEELSHLESSDHSILRRITGHSLVDGLSFSTTWTIVYSLCSLLYWLTPDIIVSAASKLFYGMVYSDTSIVFSDADYKFGDFISVLTIGAVYTFLIGVVWSFTHTLFLKQKIERRFEKVTDTH